MSSLSNINSNNNLRLNWCSGAQQRKYLDPKTNSRLFVNPSNEPQSTLSLKEDDGISIPQQFAQLTNDKNRAIQSIIELNSHSNDETCKADKKEELARKNLNANMIAVITAADKALIELSEIQAKMNSNNFKPRKVYQLLPNTTLGKPNR